MKTISNVQIKSDVAGRFKRIFEGVEFDGKLTFLTELLQNCQRAKATHVTIELRENTLSIQDNGNGCQEPNDLFTLDFSGFGVGFGEGFSSIYALGGQFEVSTQTWHTHVDVDALKALSKQGKLTEDDLRIEVEEQPYVQGFSVSITSPVIGEQSYLIMDEVKKITQIIPNMACMLNGEIIEKIDLFAPPTEHPYYRFIENRFYKAMLWITPLYEGEGIDVYHDYRFVQNLYHVLNGVNGVVEVKPNKINLKAPDRTSIIRDEKRDALLRQLKKDAMPLLFDVLKSENSEDIQEYSDVIQSHLSVEQYMKYLTIDSTHLLNQYETREVAEKNKEEESVEESYEEGGQEEWVEPEEFLGVSSYNFNEKSEMEHDSSDTKENTDENQSSYQQDQLSFYEDDVSCVPEKEEHKEKESVDTVRKQEDIHSLDSYGKGDAYERVTKKELNTVTISNIKKKANVVWVEKQVESDRSNLIAEYEYLGVFTFVSPHVLYDEALRHLGITHIDDVESEAIQREFLYKRIGAKNKKEMRAMEILHFIERSLGISDVFHFSDISCKLLVSLHQKKIYQTNYPVKAVARTFDIQLNRKSTVFGKLSGTSLGKPQLGIHDVKFVLANIETLAHELAHFIYHTQDNTLEHDTMIFELQKKIGEAIISADTLF